MKKNINIAKSISAAVALLALMVVVFNGCAKKTATGDVWADSALSSGDECVYYNDSNNNIIKKDVNSGKVTTFCENITLLSSNENSVLGTDGDGLLVIDNNGTVIDEISSITALSAQIVDNTVYYQHTDTKHITAINLETREEKDIVRMEIEDFVVHETKLVFTTKERNMIYVYDMETGIPMGYFGDKLIGDFCFDGEYLIYSDLNENGKVIKMDVATGNETEYADVKTQKFTCENNVIYYVENVEKNEESYTLKDYSLS